MTRHFDRQDVIKMAQYVKCIRFALDKRQLENISIYVDKLENLVQQSLMKEVLNGKKRNKTDR